MQSDNPVYELINDSHSASSENFPNDYYKGTNDVFDNDTSTTYSNGTQTSSQLLTTNHLSKSSTTECCRQEKVMDTIYMAIIIASCAVFVLILLSIGACIIRQMKNKNKKGKRKENRESVSDKKQLTNIPVLSESGSPPDDVPISPKSDSPTQTKTVKVLPLPVSPDEQPHISSVEQESVSYSASPPADVSKCSTSSDTCSIFRKKNSYRISKESKPMSPKTSLTPISPKTSLNPTFPKTSTGPLQSDSYAGKSGSVILAHPPILGPLKTYKQLTKRNNSEKSNKSARLAHPKISGSQMIDKQSPKQKTSQYSIKIAEPQNLGPLNVHKQSSKQNDSNLSINSVKLAHPRFLEPLKVTEQPPKQNDSNKFKTSKFAQPHILGPLKVYEQPSNLNEPIILNESTKVAQSGSDLNLAAKKR